MRRVEIVVAFAVALATGCETYETRVRSKDDPGIRIKNVNDLPEGDKKNTENQLREACEKDPDNARLWCILGDFYERKGEMYYAQAADAYEHMAALVDKFEAEHPGARYTGGHYCLGHIYALLGRYDIAIPHLEKVLELQPKDVQTAVLNPQFMEAHFLLGSIAHMHHQWRDAKKHFEAVLDLSGGDLLARTRVEPLLNEIHRQTD